MVADWQSSAMAALARRSTGERRVGNFWASDSSCWAGLEKDKAQIVGIGLGWRIWRSGLGLLSWVLPWLLQTYNLQVMKPDGASQYSDVGRAKEGSFRYYKGQNLKAGSRMDGEVFISGRKRSRN